MNFFKWRGRMICKSFKSNMDLIYNSNQLNSSVMLNFRSRLLMLRLITHLPILKNVHISIPKTPFIISRKISLRKSLQKSELDYSNDMNDLYTKELKIIYLWSSPIIIQLWFLFDCWILHIFLLLLSSSAKSFVNLIHNWFVCSFIKWLTFWFRHIAHKP